MNLEEKYAKWKEIFDKYFIYKGNVKTNGTYIPLETVSFGNKISGYVGDGTINLASYLTFLYLNGADTTVGLTVMNRLIQAAWQYNNTLCKDMTLEEGFFMRDDIKSEQAKLFNLDSIQSSYTNQFEEVNDDACHSAYVSQDQCWNLLPILNLIGGKKLIYKIFGYIVDHHHTIYNPYLSQLLWFNTYFDPSIEAYKRADDRRNKMKYKVKVKRGANNWYFAYGFKKAFNNAGGKCDTFLSSLWYKPFVFLADRLYHPYICKMFGIKVKRTSYYALGIGANAWYFGDVNKRLVKQFNKSLKSGDSLFLPELAVLSTDSNSIDCTLLLKWLENYAKPNLSGTIANPLTFMILYSFYKTHNEK